MKTDPLSPLQATIQAIQNALGSDLQIGLDLLQFDMITVIQPGIQLDAILHLAGWGGAIG